MTVSEPKAPKPVKPAKPVKPVKDDSVVRALYESLPYLDAYAEHTNQRVAADPQEAAGGLWDEVGPLQLHYLLVNGLRAEHSLLDIGCGTLRGGRHFIRSLAPGRYTGFDMSANALQAGHRLIQDEDLSAKQPRLTLTASKTLRFAEFAGERFDFLLAHAVFTNLMPEHIEECFAHVGAIMHERSLFFFTFRQADSYRRFAFKEFEYPFAFFEALAARNGFEIALRNDYYHPRRQAMAVLRKTSRRAE
jgi:predicted TPR repeat methyltransferase